MKAEEWNAIYFFSAAEFEEPEKMDVELVTMLSEARRHSGIPFKLTSTYRDGDPKTHGMGKGVDIRCSQSRPRFRILKGLILAGFNRIGIYDKHIHADVGTEDEGFDVEVTWMGKSK